MSLCLFVCLSRFFLKIFKFSDPLSILLILGKIIDHADDLCCFTLVFKETQLREQRENGIVNGNKTAAAENISGYDLSAKHAAKSPPHQQQQPVTVTKLTPTKRPAAAMMAEAMKPKSPLQPSSIQYSSGIQFGICLSIKRKKLLIC